MHDVYLAGAAGHRVQQAWEAIELELGPELQRRMLARPHAGMSPEDLWGVVRQRLIDAHPKWKSLARIVEYRGLAPLLSFVMIIATNYVRRAHERKQREPKAESDAASRPIERNDGFLDSYRPAPPDSLASASVDERSLIARLAKILQRLTPEQAALFRLVLDQGISQRDVARMLGCHESKIARELASARKVMTDAAADLLQDTQNSRLRQELGRVLRQWLAEGETETAAFVQARARRGS
ncbi:MAG: sigma factor-like helix-turn-helix DNA-binding protein [Planctomycetota bacterium]|nr:sigma factor-like helix-turn-helix DNA-binding protein [Planctomycetota bacterium]